MELKYNLKEKDYVDFNFYRITTAEANRKSILMQRFLMPAIFILIAIILFIVATFNKNTNITSKWLSFFVFGAFAFIWIYAYPVRLKKRIKSQVKGLMTSDKNKGFLGEQTLKILKNGIMVKNESGDTNLTWKQILHVAETRDHIFIFDSAISGIVVTKNAFKTTEDKDKFLEAINKKK